MYLMPESIPARDTRFPHNATITLLSIIRPWAAAYTHLTKAKPPASNTRSRHRRTAIAKSTLEMPTCILGAMVVGARRHCILFPIGCIARGIVLLARLPHCFDALDTAGDLEDPRALKPVIGIARAAPCNNTLREQYLHRRLRRARLARRPLHRKWGAGLKIRTLNRRRLVC